MVLQESNVYLMKNFFFTILRKKTYFLRYFCISFPLFFPCTEFIFYFVLYVAKYVAKAQNETYSSLLKNVLSFFCSHIFLVLEKPAAGKFVQTIQVKFFIIWKHLICDNQWASLIRFLCTSLFHNSFSLHSTFIFSD